MQNEKQNHLRFGETVAEIINGLWGIVPISDEGRMYAPECGMGYKTPFNQCLMTQCDFTPGKNTKKAMLAEYCESFSLWTLTKYTRRMLDIKNKENISTQYSIFGWV